MHSHNGSRKIWKAFLSYLSAGFLILLTGCSSTEELTSEPRSAEGAVDGYTNEWQGIWKAVQDEGLYVAAQNDRDSIYLCLQVRDRQIVQGMVFMGLTVWFDHKGGAKERWGVRFPVGLGDPESWRETMWGPRTDHEDSQDKRPFRDELQRSVRDLEIVGSDEKDITRVSTATSEREYGIKVAMRDSEGPLIYELRIPRTTHLSEYALGDIKNNVLGIEVETVKMPMMGPGQRPMRGGGSPPTGGRPPGGMGPGGGRPGGAPQHVRPGFVREKISISFELQLV